jgi:hypothetical protein
MIERPGTLGIIGNTPIVRLSRLVGGLKYLRGEVYT